MKNLFFLNTYLFKFKYKLLVGGSFILIGNLLSLLPVYYIGKSIDSIKTILNNLEVKNVFEGQEKKNLFFYGSLIIFLPILGGIIKFFMRKILMEVSRRVEFNLKNKIYENYQHLDFLTFKKYLSGDLINHLTEDLSTIRMYLGPGLMLFFNLISLFLISSLQMLRIDLWLSIYSLIPIFFICLGSFFLSAKIYKRNQKIQENRASLSSLIEGIFSGVSILKSFCLEKYFQKNHNQLTKKYQKSNLKLTQIESFLSFILSFFIGMSYLAILYIGGKKYINGQIGLGHLTEFFLYINMLSWPLNTFSWGLSIMQKAASSEKRIHFFLRKSKKNGTSSKIQNKKFSFENQLEFKNISFSYEDKKILKNISFVLKKGQILNIIGNNGSGKSTISALITALIKYQSGQILIDDQKLKEISIAELRKNVSIVSQENFLFSESIFENIISNQSYKDTFKLSKALKMAQIEKDILNLKEGYHSIYGQNGIKLSGGQKQRICLARAFYKKAPILILDDAFSAIDQRTKKAILDYIKENPYKQTIFLLSPDESLISYANQSYFL